MKQRVIGVNLDACLLEIVEEGVGRGVASHGVVHDAAVDARRGTLLEGFGNGLAGGIGRENVALQPDALPGAADIGKHGVDQRGRFVEELQLLPGDFDVRCFFQNRHCASFPASRD